VSPAIPFNGHATSGPEAQRPDSSRTRTAISCALTAIGSYGFLTRAHLQHQGAAQAAVDRDAAPLAQRIVLAVAAVPDLDGRIAQLVPW
jgi:hypothetical protein